MPSNTPNYNLVLYDRTGDTSVKLIDFRDNIAGSAGVTSNFEIIDTQMKTNADNVALKVSKAGDTMTGDLNLSNSNVAHGMTDIAATNVYGKFTYDNSTGGGLRVWGITDADSHILQPLVLCGIHGDSAPTNASITMQTGKKSGTTYSSLASTEKCLNILNNSVPVLTVLGSGYMGVGATNPSYKLDVRAGVDVYAARFSQGDTTLTFGSGWSGIEIGIANIASGEFGRINFNALDSGGNTLDTCRISSFIISRSVDNIYSDLVFYTHKATTLTEAMRINSAGNVGLGTNVPGAYLDIEKAGTVKTTTNFLELTNSGNASDMDGTGTGILFRQFYYDATTPAVVSSGRISVITETDWTSTASTQDSSMKFEVAVNGSLVEAMRIDSNQNIGIGITTPICPVHIQKTGAKGPTNFITLTNNYNAVDMDNVRTTLLFQQYYYDVSTPAAKSAGSISVITETDWTGTASTQDTSMLFTTCTDGNLVDAFKLASDSIYMYRNVEQINEANSYGIHTISTYNGNAAYGSNLWFNRASGSVGSPSIVENGDLIGAIYFKSYDGDTFHASASITSNVNGIPGTNDVPGRLVFSTTKDGASGTTEAMRIDSNQNIGIKTTSFGTNAVAVLGIATGTAPTTSPADMIQIFSVDASAGNATLGLRTEAAVVTESVTSDRTLQVVLNGTVYKLCLKS